MIARQRRRLSRMPRNGSAAISPPIGTSANACVKWRCISTASSGSAVERMSTSESGSSPPTAPHANACLPNRSVRKTWAAAAPTTA
jgi:hypothetical protein